MHQTVGCIDYLKAPLDETAEGEQRKTANYIILQPRWLLWTVN